MPLDRMDRPWKHARPEDGLPNLYAIICERSFSERYRGAPSTVILGGKAAEPMRKPSSMTLPGMAKTAGMYAIGTVSSGWTSGLRHRFAEQVIGGDQCRTVFDIRYQVIDAGRRQEV